MVSPKPQARAGNAGLQLLTPQHLLSKLSRDAHMRTLVVLSVFVTLLLGG